MDLNPLWFIIVVPLSAVIGLFFGSVIFKLKSKSSEKKLIVDAQKVLDGDKENIFDLDGKKLEVKRFKVRDDNDNEVVITFGEGKIKEEEIKEEEKEEKVEKVIFLEDKKTPKKKVNIQLLSGKKDKKVKKKRAKKK